MRVIELRKILGVARKKSGQVNLPNVAAGVRRGVRARR